MKSNKKFQFLEHKADIKIRANGKNLEEVFENSALAISDYISRNGKIKAKKKKEIYLSGEDDKELLYKFIDEIIYLLDAENFITAKAKVKISHKKLTATLEGDNSKNYKDLDHIKAATYAEMEILQKSKKNWQAIFVVDV